MPEHPTVGPALADAVPVDPAVPTLHQQVTAAVATWTGQLINLDGRNGLLYYKDLKLGTLDLTDADTSGLAALLDGQTVPLTRLLPDRPADALRRARTVRAKAKEMDEERGVRTLFLAAGMATWTNTNTKATPCAPVLLREATLRPRGTDDYDVTLTGEVEVNPTLLHLLNEQHEVPVTADHLLAGPPVVTVEQTAAVCDQLLLHCLGVPGFSVTSRFVMGNFSYAKLPMVTDLQGNVEALTQHEVIAALVGDRSAQARLRADAGDGPQVSVTDPDRTAPADEYLVLDADASQNYAINAAVAGRSLVVKGPPGTGKSQTIANLIATLVARGQSVLFVAEKRAAITAVLSRLDQVGLGDLLLDLHDGAGTRRKVAQTLSAALEASARIGRPDQQELHAQLVSGRTRLSAYSSALHSKHQPWEVSAFDAQCELLGVRARYGTAASVLTALRGSELQAMTPAVRRALLEQLREYADLGGLTLSPQTSPWVGADIHSPEQAENALLTAQRLAHQVLPDAQTTLQRTLQQTGLGRPAAVAGWREVLDLLDAVADTLTRLDAQVFTGDSAPLAAATATRKWRKAHPTWAGAQDGWAQRRRHRKAARSLWTGPGKPDRKQLHQLLLAACEQTSRWAALATDDGRPRLPADLAGTSGAYDQLNRELAALGAFVSSAQPVVDEQTLQQTVTDLAADELTLRKIPRLNALEAALRRAGLGPLMSELRVRHVDSDLVTAAFTFCVYTSILRTISLQDQTLAGFDATHHRRVSQQFRADDRTHLSSAPARVRRAAAERLVAARDQHPEQAQLVTSEAAKKSKLLSLRQLFQAAPDVLTALKPCWATSPLVVAQLLPGDKPYFDVVIFDEASQISPADAIPSILRARRVVCAGDENQLKPSSFFGASTEEDDDDAPASAAAPAALTEGFESILDVLRGVLPISQLIWHYRSRDERLIGFSNAWIYDRSLTTFPGPSGQDSLQHVLVTAGGQAGQDDSSSEEVDAVVRLVLEHASTRPHESLGVIAMGIKHANRIDAALRAQRKQRPELDPFFDETRKDAFFIKNLERVQGDERDAIILTLGYRKAPDQPLRYYFGPLNEDGGHRRLNVAVTRARARMTLVSTFSHHDMDPKRSTREGVQMLRAYLEYAASGGTNLGSVALERPQLNPFEIDVRDRLQAAGVPLTAQWGVAGYWIDFAAAHPTQPGRMVLAIEADGATYHSSPTARDRDRLRQEQLERLGWTFHRIWSTDWFRDPDSCVAQAVQAWSDAVAAADRADAAAAEKQQVPLEPVAAPSAPPVPKQPLTSVLAPQILPRQRGPRPRVVPGWAIHEYAHDDLVRLLRWIESDTLLRTEQQLLSEFMQELGFQRRGARIVEAFNLALRQARS